MLLNKLTFRPHSGPRFTCAIALAQNQLSKITSLVQMCYVSYRRQSLFTKSRMCSITRFSNRTCPKETVLGSVYWWSENRCNRFLTCEGSQMLFYVWFEFTSWLRGVGQGKGAWDCFLTIWAWDSCAFCQWDQWLLRDWTFILQMTLSWPDVDSLGLLPSALMFCLNLKKSLLQSWL